MARLRLPAEQPSVARLITFALDEAERLEVPPEVLGRVRLVVEELVVNIVSYAYRDQVLAGEVELAVEPTDGGLRLTLIDEGCPYNLLETPPPDLLAGLDERPIGGLGVHFVRSLAREIEYERSEGRNIVRLTIPTEIHPPL
jgi:serine/threonine-protein kinase RsbW